MMTRLPSVSRPTSSEDVIACNKSTENPVSLLRELGKNGNTNGMIIMEYLRILNTGFF
jgi:hypothetical protein